MKQNIYFLLVFFLAFLLSCQKDEIVMVEEDNDPLKNVATVNEGILNFNSVENYISLIESEDHLEKSSLINNLDNNTLYTSLKTVFLKREKSISNGRVLGNKEEEMIETNDFLATILNKDGMIVIGDYYFKVNLEEEKVYVLPVSLKNHFDDLLNQNLSNDNIMVFSTDDDVLDLLEEGNKGSSNSRTMLLCNDRNPSGEMEKEKFYEYTDSRAGVMYQAKIKHGYQKAGIYFSLMTEFKHMDKFPNSLLWSPASTYIYLEYYYKFKLRCRSGDHVRSGSETVNWDNKLNRRHYEGTRGIARFWIESKYEFLERNVDTGGRYVLFALPTIINGY